jgi:hypothetical protein
MSRGRVEDRQGGLIPRGPDALDEGGVGFAFEAVGEAEMIVAGGGHAGLGVAVALRIMMEMEALAIES